MTGTVVENVSGSPSSSTGCHRHRPTVSSASSAKPSGQSLDATRIGRPSVSTSAETLQTSSTGWGQTPVGYTGRACRFGRPSSAGLNTVWIPPGVFLSFRCDTLTARAPSAGFPSTDHREPYSDSVIAPWRKVGQSLCSTWLARPLRMNNHTSQVISLSSLENSTGYSMAFAERSSMSWPLRRRSAASSERSRSAPWSPASSEALAGAIEASDASSNNTRAPGGCVGHQGPVLFNRRLWGSVEPDRDIRCREVPP